MGQSGPDHGSMGLEDYEVYGDLIMLIIL